MKLIELCPKTKQNKTEVKKQQTNKKKSTNQIRTPTPTNQLTNQSQKQKKTNHKTKPNQKKPFRVTIATEDRRHGMGSIFFVLRDTSFQK